MPALPAPSCLTDTFGGIEALERIPGWNPKIDLPLLQLVRATEISSASLMAAFDRVKGVVPANAPRLETLKHYLAPVPSGD